LPPVAGGFHGAGHPCVGGSVSADELHVASELIETEPAVQRLRPVLRVGHQEDQIAPGALSAGVAHGSPASWLRRAGRSAASSTSPTSPVSAVRSGFLLRIKDVWHRLPSYPEQVSGWEIYTAVLRDGVRTSEQFGRWLAMNGFPGPEGPRQEVPRIDAQPHVQA